MKTTFEKNLDAIGHINPYLQDMLIQIKENQKFEVFVDDNENINVLDTKTLDFLYANPKEDVEVELDGLNIYREYDFLYIYGIANAKIVYELLKNKKHQRIVVIEPEIELLYIAFNFIDFSTDIIQKRVMFLKSDMLNLHLTTRIFTYSNASIYLRQFKLFTVSKYYEKAHAKDKETIEKLFLKTIGQMTIVFGNDIKDSIIGLRHHLANLPKMLSSPTLTQLFSKKNSKYAVVVSTGPSLYKQIELLKKVQDYICIVSVDASFPILIQNGIKPDFVTSMERVIETAEFFKKVPQELHKDVNFVCASLQHPDLIKTIHGNLILGMRPFGYNMYFQLDEYGYICYGMSAANMAHEMISQLRFEKCLLIGQDLAYGKDGKSHSKGHIYGDDQLEGGKDKIDKAEYELIDMEAYGGKGTVKSIYIWEAFRNYFEQTILETSSWIETINCTEGGARIDGSTERSFEDMVEEILQNGEKKTKITFEYPTKDTIKENTIKVKKIIGEILEDGLKLQKDIEKSFLTIQKASSKLENLSKEEARQVINDGEIMVLLEDISRTREKLNTSKLFNEFFYEIIKPHIVHIEIDLASIKSIFVDNKIDNKDKAIAWILGHRELLFSIAGDISYVLDAVKEWSPYEK